MKVRKVENARSRASGIHVKGFRDYPENVELQANVLSKTITDQICILERRLQDCIKGKWIQVMLEGRRQVKKQLYSPGEKRRWFECSMPLGRAGEENFWNGGDWGSFPRFVAQKIEQMKTFIKKKGGGEVYFEGKLTLS